MNVLVKVAHEREFEDERLFDLWSVKRVVPGHDTLTYTCPPTAASNPSQSVHVIEVCKTTVATIKRIIRITVCFKFQTSKMSYYFGTKLTPSFSFWLILMCCLGYKTWVAYKNSDAWKSLTKKHPRILPLKNSTWFQQWTQMKHCHLSSSQGYAKK